MTRSDLARLHTMLLKHAFNHTTLMVLCRSGSRSTAAVRLLRNLGYFLCYSVAGGVNEWQEKGLPLVYPANA